MQSTMRGTPRFIILSLLVLVPVLSAVGEYAAAGKSAQRLRAEAPSVNLPQAAGPESVDDFSLDRTWETPAQPVRGLALGGAIPLLAAVGDETQVHLWNASNGAAIATITLAGSPKDVSCLAFSPDGKWIAVGESFQRAALYTAKIELLGVATRRDVRTLATHHWEVVKLAFSADGKWLASSNWDRKIRLYQFPSGKLAHDFESASKPHSVAVSADGKLVAAGAADSTVSVWDCASGKLVQRLAAGTGPIVAIAFTPDGSQLAAGSSDGATRLWSLPSGQLLRTLEGTPGAITSIAYSPGGKFLVTGSADSTVRLWDPVTGQNFLTFGAYSAAWQVAFSPDGKYLAAGYADGTINLWKKRD